MTQQQDDPHRLDKIRSIRTPDELKGFWTGVRLQSLNLSREDWDALAEKARQFKDGRP